MKSQIKLFTFALIFVLCACTNKNEQNPLVPDIVVKKH